MPIYKGQTSKSVDIELKSYLVAAHWIQNRAAQGGKATLELQTAYVADDTEIKIQVKDNKGNSYDKLSGRIYSNFYRKIVSVPKGDYNSLMFEAELVGHGIKKLSSALQVQPPINFGKLTPSSTEGKGDKLTVQFADMVKLEGELKGVKDGEPVQVELYWIKEEDTPAFLIKSFKTVCKAGKISVLWDGKLEDAPKSSKLYFEISCLGSTSTKSEEFDYSNLKEFSFSN